MRKQFVYWFIKDAGVTYQVPLINGTSRLPARFIGDLSGIKSGAGFRRLAMPWEYLSNSKIYHKSVAAARLLNMCQHQ